jgi:hypothetical protein
MDADTLYPVHYIQTMLRKLEQPAVAGVYSLWSFIPDKEHSRLGLAIYELLRDMHLLLTSLNRPELNVRGMVFAYRTDYGRQIGFRVDIRRGEDGAMALELKKYGKLKLLLSRKARPVTAVTTLSKDGSLLKSFMKRMFHSLKSGGAYFTKKTHYADTDENMINLQK